ncbi:MAG: hypothetical protein ABI831_26720, partial [Betaproteobacteria bacterium]
MRGRKWQIAKYLLTVGLLADGDSALGAVVQPVVVPAAVRAKLATLSVPFVENGGQFAPHVRYVARLLDGSLQVTASGALVYVLPALPDAALVERFADGNARPHASLPHVTRIASFVGNDPASHRADLRTFVQVSLGEVFPGIDVTLRATGSNVEKIFTVRP